MIFVSLAGNATAASLLRAQSFPKTFDDLSFTQRNDVLAAGYEAWESEYDDSGRCISNCPYVGITINEDLAMMQRQTNIAVSQLQAAGLLPTGGVAQQIAASVRPDTMPGNVPVNTGMVKVDNVAPSAPSCTPRNKEINYSNAVPIGEPVLGRPRISSQFGDRIHPIKKKRTPHRGVDLAVPTGTDVFSPANGTVSAVWSDAECGCGVRITHSNGYESVYCHLSEQLVEMGDVVNAGCRIGKSGNTGRSTGPHLHYGIKLNGTYINPNKLMDRD